MATRPLRELTTLRLGGPAARLVARAPTTRRCSRPSRAADADEQPLLLLAGGSNVVVADAGFAGTVVRIRRAASDSFR